MVQGGKAPGGSSLTVCVCVRAGHILIEMDRFLKKGGGSVTSDLGTKYADLRRDIPKLKNDAVKFKQRALDLDKEVFELPTPYGKFATDLTKVQFINNQGFFFKVMADSWAFLEILVFCRLEKIGSRSTMII